MVKWLRHRPFTAVSWVRIPSGSPHQKLPIYQVSREFYFFLLSLSFSQTIVKLRTNCQCRDSNPRVRAANAVCFHASVRNWSPFRFRSNSPFLTENRIRFFAHWARSALFPSGSPHQKLPIYQVSREFYFFLLSLSFSQTIVKLRTNCQCRDSNPRVRAANAVCFHASVRNWSPFRFRSNSPFLTENRIRFFAHWARSALFPSGSPQQKLPIYQISREFYFYLLSQFFANHRKIADKLLMSGFELKILKNIPKKISNIFIFLKKVIYFLYDKN